MPASNNIINPQEVKSHSEQIVINAGGEILEWLPTIELPNPRALHDVINRALVLNAMYQLNLNAPKYYIADWIENNSLQSELTSKESAILYSSNQLTNEDHYDLYWSLESLWALVWTTSLIEDLPFNQTVGNELAKLSPNLQKNEDGFKYISAMKLRSIKSIYMMLDLYYRIHWWVNNAINENKSVGDLDINVIIARRKALEWVLNSDQDWDNLSLDL